MSQMISMSDRHRIVSLYESGQTQLAIAQTTGFSYKSVRTLLQRYAQSGARGLLPTYANCGQRCSYESERNYRLVRLYKHLHPQWGVSYILLQIKQLHPDLGLCCSRQYERRLKADNQKGKAAANALAKNPPLQMVYHPEKPRLPHDCLQIDAKERLTTLDGQPACYLTTSDAKSDATLAAVVFPLQSYQSSTD